MLVIFFQFIDGLKLIIITRNSISFLQLTKKYVFLKRNFSYLHVCDTGTD